MCVYIKYEIWYFLVCTEYNLSNVFVSGYIISSVSWRLLPPCLKCLWRCMASIFPLVFITVQSFISNAIIIHFSAWLPVGLLGKVVCCYESVWPNCARKKAHLMKPECIMGQVYWTIALQRHRPFNHRHLGLPFWVSHMETQTYVRAHVNTPIRTHIHLTFHAHILQH